MNLDLKWCDAKAARYAVMNWHYSRTMPLGRIVKVGAWENGKFIGCIMFARGATPKLGDAFGISQIEVCELVRVALNKHQNPVSKIVSIAVKMLKKQCPGLKLIISYADTREGHHGGIYQAMNWIYVGRTPEGKERFHDGKWKHNRTLTGVQYKKSKPNIDLSKLPIRITPGKHKYIYILDESLKDAVMSMAVPYPKRTRVASIDSDAPCSQQGEGGANPTATLDIQEAMNASTN